jgi:hypothetical protein
MAIIKLNSETYVLKDGSTISEYPVNPLSGPIRTTGVQQRSDNYKINRFVQSNWNRLGLGTARIRRESGNENIGSMLDADAETRFASVFTLPLLPETETHDGENNHLISYEHFKGNLYGFFESDYSGSTNSQTTVSSFASASDTWAATGAPVLGSSATEESSSANPSISFTVQSTSANRLLVVATTTGGASPSAVLWNGASLTNLDTAGPLKVWYIVNPDTGSHSVTTTWSAAEHQMAVMEFSGVNQSTPFGPVVVPNLVQSTSVAISSVVTARNDIAFYATTIDYGVSPGVTGATEITDSQSTNVTLQTMWERATGTSESATSSWSGTYVARAIGVAIKAAGGVIDVEETVAPGLRLFGTTVHKGSLFVLGTKAGAEGQYEWRSSVDAVTWAGGAGGNWPTTVYVHTTETRKNDWSNKYADIMSFGNNLIVAIYEDPDSSGGSVPQVRIGYSPDLGANWTFNTGLVIPCTDTPNIHLTTINDPYQSTTVLVPALVTSDNVYTLDIANHVFQDLMTHGVLSGTANEALAVSNSSTGGLYISKASGDNLQVVISGPGQMNIKNVGPASRSHGEDGDGPVATRRGHANFIYGSDPRWLFVAYGGHAAGKYASIFAMDYETGAWHSMFLDTTANQDCTALIISTEDDGVSRLHASSEGDAASTMFMLEEPLVSAITGVTQKYRATGFIEWAEDDLGDPYTNSAILKALIDDGGTLGAATTNNYAELKYGLDGAAWDDVTISDKFLSTRKTLDFEANGRGVSGKTLRTRLNLYGDDAANTNTPQIREFEVQSRNRVTVLKGWQFTIDLVKSAAYHGSSNDPEDVITALDTLQQLATLAPFQVGSISERQVELTSGSWSLTLVEYGAGDGEQLGNRTGFADITIEEVL